MKKVTTVGIDIAKSVFSVHGVCSDGDVVVRKTIRREHVAELMAQLPPCLIGMEACSGAHDRARRNDAEAICEAVTRPNMRFVPIKTAEQQNV